MKNILLITLLLFSVTIYGQEIEYNKWAVEAEIGGNRVNDESASSISGGLHFGLGLRYNLNETVGLGLTAGFDTEDLRNDFLGLQTELEYFRFNVEGYIDALNIVDLNNQYFTVLFHGGPGISFIDTNNAYSETLMNVRGGITLLFKLTDRLALKGDFSTTANLNQSFGLDGFDPNSNVGITSTLHNYSAGLVFYLGKKNKKDDKRKTHADWYEKPAPLPTEITNTFPTYVTNEVVNETTVERPCECSESFSEYVFFDHDENIIKGTGLNAIFKTYRALVDNPNLKLTIKGYASPTNSSDEYNLRLSERRADELLEKFVAMGISEDRIKTGSYGKDRKYDTKYVHDVARRVELLVE